ncbi:uncharacterized protein [Paralichthys olivaceus]|uniref:uncharacterized protein isoform X2 n=1 Tax=Paralichthys olivaceus TaxID=8255 RepID=UPI003750F5CD
MTRTTVTKIFILVILAFIICLPEFFSLYRVSKVNFICLPYRRCERGNQVKRGENGKMEGLCDPSQSAEVEKWEKACTEEKPSNMTDAGPDSRRGSSASENGWFMCQADRDMAELYSNISSSAAAGHLEVSVELQLGEAETLNLTLYGPNNSSLDLHPPEEQEEERDERKGDKGQRAFYCCLPDVLPTSESTNQSRCLLWLANQTVSTATAKKRLPWKRTGKDGEEHTEILTPTVPHFCGSRRWSELSPIKEAQSQEDIETLLDGNVNNCYTANLHHRGHPSISSITEGQQQERSTETDFNEK